MPVSTPVKEQTNTYLGDFLELEKALPSDGPSWLLPIRKAAIARFGELGFPTLRDEEWRYTNVAPITKTAFRPVAAGASRVEPGFLDGVVLPDCGPRLVFVNGWFSAELSSLDGAPKGLKVASLAETLRNGSGVIEPHLARHARYDEQPFTALNTAFMTDGAVIHLGRGSVSAKPVHVVHVSAGGERDEPVVSYPRHLIVADPTSQATIIESCVAVDGRVSLTNTVTEIVASDNAVIEHYRVQREGPRAYHLSTLHVHQGRNSTVRSHTVTLGGALVRNDIHAVLDAEGCDSVFNGLYVLADEQHVDNHLRIEHAKPHCNSWEYFKGILQDRSRGVFTGRIIVHKDAQKTDAKQTNMSLLLSEDAQVDTKPQLEIFADDVKCTHGATIGQLDADAIFYLRSRGLDEAAARSLLIYAFASESLEQIKVEALRERLRDGLLSRLPQGERIREAL